MDYGEPMGTAPLSRDFSKRLAVIIPAMNESDRIQAVISQIKRLSPDQIVVVINGSSDRTIEIARQLDAQVLEYTHPLGNDIPRACGTFWIDADIYLFLDADIVLPAEELLPFVTDIEKGVDLALNSIDWCSRFPTPDEPSIDRYFLNLILSRRDLGLENALTIPHAFSRRAVETIGKQTLANPLLATTASLLRGLNIHVANAINVLGLNKERLNHRAMSGQIMPEAYQRMHGDTIEAFEFILRERGKRGGFTQGNRNRGFYLMIEELKAKWQLAGASVGQHPRSLILSVTQHATHLHLFVSRLKELTAQIICIVHGENTEMAKRILSQYHIPYIDLPTQIGHDVAFAIGATLASGEWIVFHDCTLPIDTFELIPFFSVLESQNADVVLNNHHRYTGKLEGMHPIHIGAYFVNITAGRNDLTVSSMVLPPYGFNRKALHQISPMSLMNPVLAQLRATEKQMSIVPAGCIDHFERVSHASRYAIYDEQRIYGDFMEALYYWTDIHDYRGGFTDSGRKREMVGPSNGVYLTRPCQSGTQTDELTRYLFS